MKVVCINDSNRPSKIPQEKWVVKGKSYTVEFAVKLNIQVGKVGYKLAEIDLDETCFPYQYFSAERFRPAQESDVTVLEESLDLEHV
jgi:hypothetical protein